jgi:hypothetical protein
MGKFHVGDRAEDETTHEQGVVVYVYSRAEIRDDIVAIRFDGRPQALAIPSDCLRKLGRRP